MGVEGVAGERVRHDFLRVVHALREAGGTTVVKGREATAGLPFTSVVPPANQTSTS